MSMGGPHRHSDEPQRSDCKSMIPFIQSSSQAKPPYGVESQGSIYPRGSGEEAEGSLQGRWQSSVSPPAMTLRCVHLTAWMLHLNKQSI